MKHILLPVAILTIALLGRATGADADELDPWCAQVKKASSIVICSDSDLREQTAARQHFFDKLRETLPPDEYKTLMADQTRWVKAYTANCGVPIDGAVPTPPIPQSVIECYRQASRSRNAHLLNTYSSRASQPSAPATVSAPVIAPTAVDVSHADILKIQGRPPALPKAIIGTAWYVFADGKIDKGADERLDRFLEENHVPGKSLLFLNSTGGDLATGIKLGKVIRKHRLFTYVGKDQGEQKPYDTAAGECYSACALAFLGGEYRFYKIGSDYGVHRFYRSQKEEDDADVAQIVSATIIQYMRDMGVSPELFSYMSRAGANDIVRLTEADMKRLNVTNGGLEPTVWTIESRVVKGSSAAVYLKGERETWRGINKFMLLCMPGGKVMLYVIYDPEGRGDEVINLLNAHSLVIDDDSIPISDHQIERTELVNGWINARYLLTPALIQRLETAHTVGIEMQAKYNAPLFMGFLGMELGEGRSKLIGLFNLCGATHG